MPVIGRIREEPERTTYSNRGQREYNVESRYMGRPPNAFADEFIRQEFIKNVYMHLVAQLLIVFLITVSFNLCDPLRDVYVENWKVFYFASVPVTIVILIMFTCCPVVRHSFPINYFLLFIYDVAWGFVVVGLSLAVDPGVLMIALGITTALFILLTMFAMTTSIDFTNCLGILALASLVILILSVVAIFVRAKAFHLVISGLVIIIFSIYIIVDTQMMVGGNHEYILDESEYILAAILLFVDFITIFIHIIYMLSLGECE